jgi:hypothetical protein
MNLTLRNGIKTSLTKSVSGLTSNIFEDHLPNVKNLLTQLTVVYNLRNTRNANNFDGKEINKFYSLDVKFNSPDVNKLDNTSIYSHKDRLYKELPCSYINLIDEDLLFDPAKQIWVSFYRYEIQAG